MRMETLIHEPREMFSSQACAPFPGLEHCGSSRVGAPMGEGRGYTAFFGTNGWPCCGTVPASLRGSPSAQGVAGHVTLVPRV